MCVKWSFFNNHVFHKISRQDQYQLHDPVLFFSSVSPPWGYRNSFVLWILRESTLTSHVTQMYWLCFQNVVLVLQVLLPFFKKDSLAVHRSEVSNTCIFKYVPVYYSLIIIIIFFCKAVNNCTWSHPAIKGDDRLGINVSTAKISSALKHGNPNSGNNTPERLSGVTLRPWSRSKPFTCQHCNYVY